MFDFGTVRNYQGSIKWTQYFLTGNAGTGKSFVVQKLIDQLPKEGMFVTGSTGISSVQLGGLTVHSFAGIGHTSAPDDT